MSFFFYLALFTTVALVIYNVISYLHAVGTVAERLASCWKGSMTIFTLIWTSILGFVVNGSTFLSSITGDPQFAAIGSAVKEAAGPGYAPYVAIITMALPLVLGTIARTRSLPK